LKGKVHCIDPQMAQVSGNGRRRRARENNDRYPRREAAGHGRGRMGPFCVCRGGGQYRFFSFVGGQVWTVGKEQEKMEGGRGFNKWLSTLLLVI
jgi:hypothetical protein